MDIQNLNQTPPPKTYKVLWSVIGVLLLIVVGGSVYWWKEIKKTDISATITVKGTVVSNYQGCSFDDACVLTIQTDMGQEIGVVYGGGLTPEGSCNISGGHELITGDQIEASGRFTDQSKNTISLCGLGAYLKKINKEYSDWKTYTNIEYGFEFKYPGDWRYNESQIPGLIMITEDGEIKTAGKFIVRIRTHESGKTLNDYANFVAQDFSYEMLKSYYDPNKSIIIDQLDAVQTRLIKPETPPKPVEGWTLGIIKTTIVIKSSDVYIIQGIGVDVSNTELIYNQILSTFKFIR